MKSAIVEVFKTNVQQEEQANLILNILSEIFPSFKINFDLDDCDKILRIEHSSIESEKIIALLNANGFQCEVLV